MFFHPKINFLYGRIPHFLRVKATSGNRIPVFYRPLPLLVFRSCYSRITFKLLRECATPLNPRRRAASPCSPRSIISSNKKTLWKDSFNSFHRVLLLSVFSKVLLGYPTIVPTFRDFLYIGNCGVTDGRSTPVLFQCHVKIHNVIVHSQHRIHQIINKGNFRHIGVGVPFYIKTNQIS